MQNSIVFKSMFEHQILNKCSSYIDTNKQYKLAANIIMDNSVKTTKSTKKKNIKKIRSMISNKLRKLINMNNSPDEFNLAQNVPKQTAKKTKSSKQLDSSIKLLNFNYKSNFATMNTSNNEFVRKRDEQTTRRMAPTSIIQLTPIQTRQRNQFIDDDDQNDFRSVLMCASQQQSRFGSNLKSARRNSNGMSSSSSSSRSSLASANSDELFLVQTSCHDMFESELFKSQEISHLFPCSFDVSENEQHVKAQCSKNQIHQTTYLNLTENLIETSTPVVNRIKRSFEESAKPTSLFLFNNTNNTNSTCISQETEVDNIAYYMDQSTQCQVDSPVLIESTFNHSSLSNLSDDLIILQTASAPVMPTPVPVSFRQLNSTSKKQRTETSKDWNMLVIDKYHNNTNATFDNIPQWAHGNNLNLALVDQLYYNPSAKGVFNPSVLVENTFSN